MIKQYAIRAVIYGVLAGIFALGDYLFLPAWTLESAGFRWFILFLGGFILLTEAVLIEMIDDDHSPFISKFILGLGSVMVLIFLFFGVINIFNGPIFRSTDYAALIDVEEKDFQEDFFVMEESAIPMMDRETASRLGSRRIGSMNDLVSQFVPADTYTQINIQDEPYRVTPLKYAGFFRWYNNRHEGIPNYLLVDMVSGEVEVAELDDNIMYSDSEYFGRNVRRHLRRRYRRTLFRNPSFEVDDNGHPHYIATTYENRFAKRQLEPNGLIVLDAVTGDTEHFDLDDMPSWVDRVYASDIIMNQLNYYGRYQSGFMNSLFERRGVTRTTEGYNYIPMNDDVYLYTGVTSVNSDASNIGFYLVNLRTKEAEFYPVTSADEHSAMESAEGSLQQMRFESTFPLLMNLNDRPYYISSLKDDSGLVRSYALVDAQDYQRVITSDTVDGLISQLYGRSPEEVSTVVEEIDDDEELYAIVGSVDAVSEAVVAGNTVYYIMMDGEIYKADVSLHDALPFLAEGQRIEGTVNANANFRTIDLTDNNE